MFSSSGIKIHENFIGYFLFTTLILQQLLNILTAVQKYNIDIGTVQLFVFDAFNGII